MSNIFSWGTSFTIVQVLVFVTKITFIKIFQCGGTFVFIINILSFPYQNWNINWKLSTEQNYFVQGKVLNTWHWNIKGTTCLKCPGLIVFIIIIIIIIISIFRCCIYTKIVKYILWYKFIHLIIHSFFPGKLQPTTAHCFFFF